MAGWEQLIPRLSSNFRLWTTLPQSRECSAPAAVCAGIPHFLSGHLMLRGTTVNKEDRRAPRETGSLGGATGVGSLEGVRTIWGAEGSARARKPGAGARLPWAPVASRLPTPPPGTFRGPARSLTASQHRQETIVLFTIRSHRLIMVWGFVFVFVLPGARMAAVQCGNWVTWQPPTPLMDENHMVNYSFPVKSVWQPWGLYLSVSGSENRNHGSYFNRENLI